MKIDSLITLMRSSEDCIVEPPTSQPYVSSPYELPRDLQHFYSLCGGVRLWKSSNYPVRIVSADEVVLANPLIVGELCPEDITSSWYIIAACNSSDYLTVDLSRERGGLCYDSFFDRHGIIGACPIIANSFSDLLNQLWTSRGKHWYWLDRDFEYLGDAYDLRDG